MENQAQRLRDLRAELRTIEELLDMAENDAQRRQYLLEKMSVQREINYIHSGGDGALNRGKNSDASVGPPAAQPMSQGPQYQHQYGSESGRSQYYGGPQVPAAPAMPSDRGLATHVHGGSQEYQTSIPPADTLSTIAVDPGRRRTLNIFNATETENPAGAFQIPGHQQLLPRDQVASRPSPASYPESHDDAEYRPGALTNHTPRQAPTPRAVTTPRLDEKYKQVKPNVPLYNLIVRDAEGNRTVELHCPVCHGNSSRSSKNRSYKVLSGVRGLKMHMDRSHARDGVMSIAYIMDAGVKHTLTPEEEQQVADETYMVECKLVSTSTVPQPLLGRQVPPNDGNLALSR